MSWHQDFFLNIPPELEPLFAKAQYPWDPLKELKSYCDSWSETENSSSIDHTVLEGNVFIHPSAKIEPFCYIQGPCYIGPEAEIRSGAYIRGYVWVGAKAVIGHTTEVKHSIIMSGAKAAHFNYIGDSILGSGVNLGAGTKLANVRSDLSKQNLTIRFQGQKVDSGLRKFGAILGDDVKVGCNSVTNPGTVIGRNTVSFAQANLAGYYPPESLVKTKLDRV